MTRAYAVIEKNGKIVDAYYIGSDGYPNREEAVSLLQAFHDGKFQEAVAIGHKEWGNDYDDMLDGIVPAYYRGDNVFADYSYVLRGNTLHVYHYGKPVFVVTKKTADVWLAALGMDEILYEYLGHNPETLTNSLTTEKYYRVVAKKIRDGEFTAESLRKIAETYQMPEMELENFHVTDVWHRPDRPAYKKILKVRGKKIEFIVNKDWSWGLDVQLPYCRTELCSQSRFPSEAAATKAIAEIANKAGAEKMHAFAVAYGMVEDALSAVDGAMKVSIHSAKQEALAQIKKLRKQWEAHPWWVARGAFELPRIEAEIRRHV